MSGEVYEVLPESFYLDKVMCIRVQITLPFRGLVVITSLLLNAVVQSTVMYEQIQEEGS